MTCAVHYLIKGCEEIRFAGWTSMLQAAFSPLLTLRRQQDGPLTVFLAALYILVPGKRLGERKPWTDGGRGPYTQNQCNRSSYQTVCQFEGREGDRKAFTHLCPPHLFISPSVLSLALMSCLAIVSPGLFKSNSPLRKSGGIAGSSSYHMSP